MLIPFFRTLILYFLIIIAIRLMGKRQVGEMQPTELVITILVSAVASVPMQDIDIPLAHGVVPILTLIAAEVLISSLSLKWLPFRMLLTGKPVPVIRDGVIDQKAIRKLRLSLDDIFEDLRLKNINDIRQVKHAQVETNGQLSILMTSLDSPLTPRTAKIKVSEETPFHIIISDGHVLQENLAALNKSRLWLNRILQGKGVHQPSEVFLLCVNESGDIIFSRKV